MSRTSTTADATATAEAERTIQHVDPTTLLVDVNVRHDARLTADFIASIRDRGVLQPIVAVRTVDGGLRVRLGHRRTLAAVEAERPTVPVDVVGDEAADDAGTIDRLVDQYVENEHRAALTSAERVGVAAQLSLLGVSAAQIAKRTKMPRQQVDAALTVAASDLAKAATARYDFLDLTQAAAVAEFEDDTDTVKALVAAAKSGRFDHVLQQARDARRDAKRREDFAQQIRDAGVAVIDSHDADGPVRRLTRLANADGQPLTAENHADCPGHAAHIKETWGYIDSNTGQPPVEDPDREDDDSEDADGPAVVYGQYLTVAYACTDYIAHGHQVPAATAYGSDRPKMADLTPEQQEQARAARRDVIDSNKAWRSAETVRRDWLRTFLTRKTAPKGTAVFVAAAIARHGSTVASTGGNHLTADLLGVNAGGYGPSNDLAELVAKATDARAQVLTLAQVLAAYEDATHIGSWRSVNDGTRRYLEFIAANGYTLAEVERRACGQDPLPEQEHGDSDDAPSEADPA